MNGGHAETDTIKRQRASFVLVPFLAEHALWSYLIPTKSVEVRSFLLEFNSIRQISGVDLVYR